MPFSLSLHAPVSLCLIYQPSPWPDNDTLTWHSGALEKADMTVETIPIISVYLGSEVGRPPKKARNDHRLHASVNIVAHKSSEYVCNSNFADRKLQSSAPKVGTRQPELDVIGVVVSANHPPMSTTYLAPAAAEYCAARSAWHMRLGNVGFYDGQGCHCAYFDTYHVYSLCSASPLLLVMFGHS